MARHQRSAEGLTALLVVAISPTLIIFMVGSLVFFLTHMMYDGEFPERLRFSCGLFVLAAVLIARIAIDEGREYASFFALPLSIVTLLSIMKYTDVGLILILPLVAFIWWSTDKLTWDCTVIDDQKDASGQGLLESVGFGNDGEAHIDREATTDSGRSDEKSMWQRWVDRRRRHHTPGVWVVYFGLAAIPVFGLGQSLLPDYARGQGFVLLCVYVASALALLMTTSFLQLRRYLLQRGLSLPDETARTWLLIGTMMIGALMFVCLLLPRPNTGYSVLDAITKASSRDDLRASRRGVGREGVSDEKEAGGAETAEEAAKSQSAQGKQRSTDAERGSQPDPAGEPSGEGAASQRNGGDEKSSGEPGKSTSNGEKATREQNNARSQQAVGESRGEEDSREQDEAESRAQDTPQSKGQRPSDDEGSANKNTQSATKSMSNVKPPAADLLPNLSLGGVAKWIYLGLMALIVGFVLVRYGREIAASIQAFLRDFAEFWRRLFGGKPTEKSASGDEAIVTPSTPAKPFASFQDPFSGGLAAKLSPQQLVNYTFDAMQAWAVERNCGRNLDQTPLEFASQLSGANKQFGTLARNLAILYNQAAYAPGSLTGEATEHVRRVWVAMRR